MLLVVFLRAMPIMMHAGKGLHDAQMCLDLNISSFLRRLESSLDDADIQDRLLWSNLVHRLISLIDGLREVLVDCWVISGDRF
jgi:hypothetical protein